MAGGIDWFRWHHGSVNDPKFRLVARRACVRLGDVLAMWALLLEQASAAAERGHPGNVDFEAIDLALDLEDGASKAVYRAMVDRDLIDGETGRIVAWDKRQPKREDETASERKRRQREREHELRISSGVSAVVTCEESRHVTQSHAGVTQGHDREEESREDIDIELAKASSRRQQQADDLPPCPSSEIVGLYHDKLPELPRVRLESEKRKKAMRVFWRWVLTSKKSDGERRAKDADQALTWIAAYFERARANEFLMGSNRRGWTADIDYLMTERGRKAVIEKTREETA